MGPVNEDESADSKDKGEKVEVKHDEDAAKAPQEYYANFSVNNKEKLAVYKEKATTDNSSKESAAMTTAASKKDEPQVAADTTGTLVTCWTNFANVWSCGPCAFCCGQG
ncbi:hypothetical protein MRX96_038397 [Rhipicephalus microplus]